MNLQEDVKKGPTRSGIGVVEVMVVVWAAGVFGVLGVLTVFLAGILVAVLGEEVAGAGEAPSQTSFPGLEFTLGTFLFLAAFLVAHSSPNFLNIFFIAVSLLPKAKFDWWLSGWEGR
mgnify:CR=1 FL=1